MKKSEYQRFSRRLKLPAARSSGQGCIKLRDFSLSSIGWRRGLGRGGAFLLVSPLLGPLPTLSSRGEDGALDPVFSSGFEDIAHPAQGVNHLLLEVPVDLVSQPANDDVHDVGLGIKTIVPHVLHDHRLGNDLARVAQ